MIRIKGQIQSGIGRAQNMLPQQKPFLRTYVQDIDNFFNGTINVLLERPLIIFRPEILTPDFTYSNGKKERFGFQKIKFEVGDNEHDAWIYIPYCSPHRSNPFLVEIIGKTIQHSPLDYCHIKINRIVREMVALIIE